MTVKLKKIDILYVNSMMANKSAKNMYQGGTLILARGHINLKMTNIIYNTSS